DVSGHTTELASEFIPSERSVTIDGPSTDVSTGDARSISQPEPERRSAPTPDILLGAHELTPQFGLMGRHSQSTVAVDLTGCNTISLFGVQGFGKSYTLGVIAEMATTPVQGINVLPAPLATVIFHYHKSDAYPPEFASASAPNAKVREIERLRQEYGAQP